MTLSEILLWKQIKGKQVLGYDFHRQKPIDEYVVDYGQPHEFCATTYHIDDQAGLLLFSIIIQEE